MINEPVITATCDKCDYTTDEMSLCALAGGGWDDRYIVPKLRKWGWRVDGDETICENCVENENEDAS